MIRLADKKLLTKLNAAANHMNYNRQVVPEAIEKLPDDVIVAVSPIMIHEHAAGKPVDPHLRCSLQIVHPASDLFRGLFLDIPCELFERLPPLPTREVVPASGN
jgi:hypothetical protein